MDDNEHQRAGELGQTGNAPLSTADKGKGKAVDVHHDDPMDEDEDDEEESEESAHEEDVRFRILQALSLWSSFADF